MINRSAVIVRPGPGFMQWAAGLDDSGILPSPEGEQTVYLIPEYGDEVEAMEILAEGCQVIFELELEGWYADESTWPKNRTFAMFREWFVIEFHSVVDDLCDFPLVDEDM